MDERIEQAIVELGSEEKEVRQQAALLLQKMGAPAVMPLMQALRSELWRVRAGAAGTLGVVEDSSVIPALFEMLKDEHEIVRWVARRALEARHKVDPKEHFLPALQDEDEYVRRFAANLLSAYFESQSVDALISALKEPMTFIPSVAIYGPPAVQEMAEKSSFIPILAVRSLVKIGEPARDPLFQAMQESEMTRLICAEVLAIMKDARATLYLVPCLALRDQTEGRRAAIALQCIGDVYTLPRNIVAETRLSVSQRIEILKGLDRLRFYRWEVTEMHLLPDISAFCQQILCEKEPEYHEGAWQILNHYTLLRGSERDTSRENAELLRPPSTSSDPTLPTTLLRSAAEEDLPKENLEKRPGLLQRLFRRRAD